MHPPGDGDEYEANTSGIYEWVAGEDNEHFGHVFCQKDVVLQYEKLKWQGWGADTEWSNASTWKWAVTYLKRKFSKPCKEFTDVALEVRPDVSQKQKGKNLKQNGPLSAKSARLMFDLQ